MSTAPLDVVPERRTKRCSLPFLHGTTIMWSYNVSTNVIGSLKFNPKQAIFYPFALQ